MCAVYSARQANSCYALCILSFDAYIPPGPAAALSRPSSRTRRYPGENGVVIGSVSLDEDPAQPVHSHHPYIVIKYRQETQSVYFPPH